MCRGSSPARSWQHCLTTANAKRSSTWVSSWDWDYFMYDATVWGEIKHRMRHRSASEFDLKEAADYAHAHKMVGLVCRCAAGSEATGCAFPLLRMNGYGFVKIVFVRWDRRRTRVGFTRQCRRAAAIISWWTFTTDIGKLESSALFESDDRGRDSWQ